MNQVPFVIGFLVSVVIFIATEFYYPVPVDHYARRQKHFWATILFAFSLVLSLVISSLVSIDHGIQDISIVFRRSTSYQLEDALKDFHSKYYEHVDRGDERVRAWTISAIRSFNKDMREGKVFLPRREVATQIGQLYGKARTSIIATNLGDLSFFFKEGNRYLGDNVSAVAERHIPVIRFFLITPRRPAELNGGSPKERSPDEWLAAIEKLHNQLQTLVSIVIIADDLPPPETRDLVLIDTDLVAESQFEFPSTEVLGAYATTGSDSVADVRLYLTRLFRQHTHLKVFTMDDEQVAKNFPQFAGTPISSIGLGQPNRAMGIFVRLFRDISAAH